jgi:hypothetical protein
MMFDMLLESRGRPSRPVGGLIASTAFHCAIIGLIVVASSRPDGALAGTGGQSLLLTDDGSRGPFATIDVPTASRDVAIEPSPGRESGLRWIGPDMRSITGRAVVEFVIDPLGRADSSSLVVLHTDHPRFVDAIRAELRDRRFTLPNGDAPGAAQMVTLRVGFTRQAPPPS